MSASPKPLNPPKGGVLFGNYVLVECIAESFMAKVYRARQEAGGVSRTIAIKTLHPRSLTDAKTRKMFFREVEICTSLSHPNLVAIHDFGELHGCPFVVMEWIDGMNVKELLRERKRGMPSSEASRIIVEAARGLEHAHSKGIVHRDISPHNIMVARGGQVKLIDFGIALRATGDGDTMTDQIRGKTSYMSPEQAQGEDLDASSDLFSLGVVFFEMLRGHKLFEAPSDIATLGKICRCDEVVRGTLAAMPEIPDQLKAVLKKLVRAERKERYAAASELVRDLEAISGPQREVEVMYEMPSVERAENTMAVSGPVPVFWSPEGLGEFPGLAEGTVTAEAPAPSEKKFEGLSLVPKTEAKGVPLSLIPTERPSSGLSPISYETPRAKPADKPQSDPLLDEIEAARRSQSRRSSWPAFLLLCAFVAGGAWIASRNSSWFGKPLESETALAPDAPAAETVPPEAPEAEAPLAPMPDAEATAHALAPGAYALRLWISPSLDLSTEVIVDGRRVLPSADSTVEIERGRSHRVGIRRAGFRPVEREIFDQESLAVDLLPLVAGKLTFKTSPPASVQISNGRMVWERTTPVVDLALPPGDYSISVMNDEGKVAKIVPVRNRQDSSTLLTEE
ncbi:MAG TPA: serine/threonine-protein kinase [Bdellovibrionota bacterium]|nr:serine/threonine-protein kinase [Bdellovibrionota bacterium]